MSQRTVRQAVERARRATARADASVLRQQRNIQEIKVKARKKKNSIKFKMAGDMLARKERKISREEFNRRVNAAVAEIHEIDGALARIGVEVGNDRVKTGPKVPMPALPDSPPPSAAVAARTMKPIVRFWEPPPDEFRHRLKPEFGLTYDRDTRSWCGFEGNVNPVKIEAAIRAAGHWGLVQSFPGSATSP